MTDSTQPLKTKREGRQPLWTPDDARRLLDNRKLFLSDRLTCEQFIEQMVIAGELPKSCSPASMRRLLHGHMFPGLRQVDKDGIETSALYDYSSVPKSPRGRPVHSSKIDPETGELKPRLTARQDIILKEALEKARLDAALTATRVVREELNRVFERLEVTERRLAALETSVGRAQ